MASAMAILYTWFILSNAVLCYASTYDVARDYSGSDFFSEWDFYGNDNSTGDVQYLDQADATSQNLAYVSPQGTAIVKVDNTTNVPWNTKRNSIRITSRDSYPVGSLWIIDAVHMPFGCSVWPSVWTTGIPWPQYGEIDIIEGVNLMTSNQMAIRSSPGCMKTNLPTQIGQSNGTDCSQGFGCTVNEEQPNSYGSAFAQAGGGVFAAQLDATGIYIWFWSRPNVPAVIQQATSTSTMDISSWGNASAAYPTSSCNIGEYFGAQKLVVDINLCGDWAGVPLIYNQTCANTGPTGQCAGDNVFGPGNPRYNDAYFEFNYIRGYTLSISSTTAVNYSSPTAQSQAVVASSTAGADSLTSAEWPLRAPGVILCTALLAVVGFYMV